MSFSLPFYVIVSMKTRDGPGWKRQKRCFVRMVARKCQMQELEIGLT